MPAELTLLSTMCRVHGPAFFGDRLMSSELGSLSFGGTVADLVIGHEDASMKLTTSVRTATGLRRSLREQVDPFDLTAFLERFFRACNLSEGLQCGAHPEK